MADAVAVFTPGQRLIDTSGVPFSSCEVTFCEAGTTTPKLVYADADLTVSLGSTIYTDSAGYPVTAYGSSTKTLVYTDTSAYKITISSNSITIAEHDNVKGAVVASGTSGGSFLTQDAADVRYVRNPNALSAVTTLTTGDKLPAFIASAAGNRHINWENLTADLLGEWRTAGYIFGGPRNGSTGDGDAVGHSCPSAISISFCPTASQSTNGRPPLRGLSRSGQPKAASST